MSPQMIERLWQAFLDTALMVGVSAGIAVLAGIPLALFLVTSGPGGIFPAPVANRVVGTVVNGFRAVPFIVLLVALIPFTRLVAGTSIGTAAAIVPLAVASIPYYARVAEVSLREVDAGLVEAVRAMGGSRLDIVREVLLPEALPGLVSGFTLTLVTLVGASAMAGAIGAGGLGDLAIRYGYQRFETEVMVIVVVVLILLVSMLQWAGDALSRRLDHRARG